MNQLDILEVGNRAGLVDGAADMASVISWPEIVDRVAELAQDIPVSDTERRVFGIQAENDLETLLRIFSVLHAGGLAAPFSPNTSTEVRDACLERLDTAALWTAAEGWRILGGTGRQPEGFELVMHSSGSTAVPKPIAVRLAAMRTNARDVAEALGLSASDRHIGTMSHCYMSGLYNAVILPLVTDAKAISVPIISPLTVGDLLKAVARHRPTVLWLNPLVSRLLSSLRGIPNDGLRGIRFAISCTAPLPKRAKAEFESKFGIPLLQSYGLSETLITTVEDPNAPAPCTVGKPVGGEGAVTLDQEGQIVVANGALLAGYLTPAPKTARLEPFSAYDTGDLGQFDEAGNVIVTGRLSETINRHGIKISAECIENVIVELPGVRECAVTGYEDPERGCLIIAWINGEGLDRGAMFATLRKELSPHEHPHRIEFVDEFPRTPTGKIDRRTLRENSKYAVR